MGTRRRGAEINHGPPIERIPNLAAPRPEDHGSDLDLAVRTLRSPAGQAAKREFVADLRARYGLIGGLNDAWGSRYATWEERAGASQAPDPKRAGGDLRRFAEKYAHTYFRTIKEELAAAAPGQLDPGCRSMWDNETAVRAACRWCDVVSFNRYQDDVGSLQLPRGEDRPVLIGEFHFGAPDRGLFHPSEVPARSVVRLRMPFPVIASCG